MHYRFIFALLVVASTPAFSSTDISAKESFVVVIADIAGQPFYFTSDEKTVAIVRGDSSYSLTTDSVWAQTRDRNINWLFAQPKVGWTIENPVATHTSNHPHGCAKTIAEVNAKLRTFTLDAEGGSRLPIKTCLTGLTIKETISAVSPATVEFAYVDQQALRPDGQLENYRVRLITRHTVAAAVLKKKYYIPSNGSKPAIQRAFFIGRTAHGTGVNAGYDWHIIPESGCFQDRLPEVCDGRPSYIGDAFGTPVFSIGEEYCPWGHYVKDVLW